VSEEQPKLSEVERMRADLGIKVFDEHLERLLDGVRKLWEEMPPEARRSLVVSTRPESAVQSAVEAMLALRGLQIEHLLSSEHAHDIEIQRVVLAQVQFAHSRYHILAFHALGLILSSRAAIETAQRNIKAREN
jgi:hypothetical protein